MMQLKSKLIFGIPIMSFLISAVTTYSILTIFNYKQAEISQLEIAEQKSVIEEQNAIGGGAGYLINPKCPRPVVIIIPAKNVMRVATITEEEEQSNPYSLIIESLTDEEKELICRITWLEAGNQGEDGQRAVMEVILNRVLNENYFPDTVYGVLSADGQFSTWAHRNKVTNDQVEQMQEILKIVQESDTTILTEDYVYFDGVQHSYGANYKQVKDHWFGTMKTKTCGN